MNRTELINEILKIDNTSFRAGVATVYANYKTMKKLHEAGLLNMNYARKGGPTVETFYNFMEKYSMKKIEARLMVIDPKRDDFRIGVEVISVASEYAKIKTDADLIFWGDFMHLGKEGNACMAENAEWVSWGWYN